ncbi:cyclopropane fatty acyl phospholipid synthase [Geodermatophilus sp. SYSU D01176]
MTNRRPAAGALAVRRLLRAADIVIGGDRPWDICVLDDRFYGTVLRQGSLGFGESYMRNWWCAEDLEDVIFRLIGVGLDRAVRLLPARISAAVTGAVTNQQTIEKSTAVAERHYNLGNDLFFALLGKYRNYSCAYFDGTDSLDDAQVRKMDLVCRKLELGESDHLLDVGGGWGHLAHYAATHYGCRVTSINISDEQIRYARDLCSDLPVDVQKCDYREVTGSYTKIAVIAMLTHVGPKNYRRFMQIMHGHLADDGSMLVESIGGRFSNTTTEPWIQKYIFPGGVIPSMRQFESAISGYFTATELVEWGQHYVPTLRAWHANLMAAWPTLSDKYSETTRLMMEYYLLASAAAFRAGRLKYWHLALARR